MLKFQLWTDTEEKPKTKSIEQDCVKIGDCKCK